MKKFFVAILAILYLGTSIGATIQLHYCMGRFVEATLSHNKKTICGRCGMEKKPEATKGCCKDEYKQIKIDKDQKPSGSYTQLNVAVVELDPANFNYLIFSSSFSPEIFAKINAPPLRNTSLNLLNCVFRI
jgi:ribosomal protein L40E